MGSALPEFDMSKIRLFRVGKEKANKNMPIKIILDSESRVPETLKIVTQTSSLMNWVLFLFIIHL